MTEQHAKEQMSLAYVKAIAASAGVGLREGGTFDYGIDGRFLDFGYDYENNRHYENGFGIDFQLKATTNIAPKGCSVLFDLEIKNYNDLIITKVGTPRILIVYSMPKEHCEWMKVSSDDAILKRCAWWCSLRGQDPTKNKSKKRIELPMSQRLTPNELKRLIQCVKEGVDL